MQRLERLVDLVAALIDAPRPLTREEIRDRIPEAYAADDGAYKRAFERDKDTLRQMGIPITVEPLERDNADSPVGYRIRREDYELPDPGLEPDELAALHLAASAVRIDGVAGKEAIWKLGGAIEKGAANALAEVAGSAHLPVLFGAIAAGRTVSFGYRGAPRTADPYFLSFRRGIWYLIAHDHDRDDRRTFRLDRIEDLEAGPPGAFSRPGDLVGALPPPWEMGDEEPVEITFVVDAPFAEQVVAQVGADAIVESGAELTTFCVRVTNRSAFRTLVLDLLDHAEVVAPDVERADLVDWLQRIVVGTGPRSRAGAGR